MKSKNSPDENKRLRDEYLKVKRELELLKTKNQGGKQAPTTSKQVLRNQSQDDSLKTTSGISKSRELTKHKLEVTQKQMNTFSGPPKDPSHKMGNREMAKSQQHTDEMTSGRRNDHKRADTELPNIKKAINLNLEHSVNEHDNSGMNNMADSARQPQVLANNLKDLFIN